MDDRIILHIDLDCFYCQVEHRRLGIPREVPLAVQQWDGLIAVNYPAREQGVTRHMRTTEALAICPNISLVHVQTIGDGDSLDGPVDKVRLTQKACLERYRLANAEILDVLHTEVPNSRIEKASIDEVYIDVTDLVDLEMPKFEADRPGRDSEGQPLFSWGSVVYGTGSLDPMNVIEKRLSYGAMIASRLRGAIQTKTGFSSSAGISVNKLLAKIGSAKNKPNQQTLIRPRVVQELMSELPLRKLRLLGGKFGEELASLCKGYIEDSGRELVVADVHSIPYNALVAKFGTEKSSWVHDMIQGRDSEDVKEREKQKSMLAAKSFAASSDITVIERWISILAAELAPRMKSDYETYNRRPKTLGVHFRQQPKKAGQFSSDRTRQSPMPRMPPQMPCKKILTGAAMEIFKTRCASEAMPCVRLALSASDFVECPNESKAITRFLTQVKKKAISSCDDNTAQNTSVQLDSKVEEKQDGISCPLLDSVNVEEQEKLLREASMLHRLEKSKANITQKNQQVSKRIKTGGIQKFFQPK
ncbi:DNA polymerase eta [Picochlorum sp. SENEW3]|nr:DNA polymerase eta [Picochlorum sp. SENEW3]